ncbi:MAG: hypothetical protein ABWZ85_04450 [Luteibacter sp.]
MDMMPPQAPPAITSSQQQRAQDAVGRLAATQGWLAAQRDALPALPGSPAEDGKNAFLDRLTEYWRTPVAPPGAGAALPRAAALSRQLADAMRDDAILLGLDGTLDERAVDWATRFARAPDGVPTTLRASELLVGGQPYAGAIVLQARDTDNLALLFTADAGWQAFASLAALHDETERRLREALVGDRELPGVARDDLQPFMDGPLVSSRDAGPDAFDVMVGRIAALQEQRVSSAWDDFAVGLIDNTGLADRVCQALDPFLWLDVHAMLTQRDARLGESVSEARLADVPTATRNDWRRARDAYRDALTMASEQRRALGIDEVLSLEAFTEDALSRRLARSGITVRPHELFVRVSEHPSTPLAWLSHMIGGPSPQRVGLVELAYQNVGQWQAASLVAELADGSPVSPALDGAAIREIVRDADIARRYARYLDQRLLTSATGQAARGIAVDLHQARMRFELEESRLSYYRRDEPRAFRYADHDIAYRWLKAVVDSPDAASRATVDGHTIVARQVTYRGQPIADILEVGSASMESSSRVAYYTPDAPDGVSFREFYSREDAAREFFHHPAYEAYLLDRLPADAAETAANGTRRFKVSPSAQRNRWVFAQQNAGRYTRMEENLVERDVAGNVIEALYDASLGLMKANTALLTRTTSAADWQAATHAISSATAASSPVPTLASRMAEESLRQAGRTMPSLWRMEDNLRAGDHAQAFVDLVEAYHSSLNVIGAHPALVLRSPATMLRAGHRSPVLVPSRQNIAEAAGMFEARFQAPAGVKASAADAVGDGVLRINGRSYVQQEGKLYAVRFDAGTGSGTWRLTRPGNLDAHFSGPAIERTTAGGWRHADIGLRGGGKDALRKISAKASGSLDRRVRRLSEYQVRTLLRELTRLTGSRTTALEVWTSMRPADAARRGLVPPITPQQQAYWYQSLQAAEQAPARLAPAPARVAALPTPPRAPSTSEPSAALPGPSGGSVAVGSAVVATPPMSASRLPATRIRQMVEVAPEAWPDAAWVYLTPDRVRGREGATNINLAQNQFGHDDLRGLIALEQAPWTPLTQVEGFPPSAITPGGTLGTLLGGTGWVRIDLNAVRNRVNADVMPLFRVAMTDGPSGTRALLIRPRTTAGDPEALRNVWLLNGEFQLGVWPGAPGSR